MIIKRYNGENFVELFPKTTTTRLFNSTGATSLFDSNDKIKPNFLPNSVFDSLYFYSTTTSGTLNTLIANAIKEASRIKRSPIGFYYVATAGTNLTPGISAFVNFVTTSATTEEGSATVTGVNSLNLTVGYNVTGTGIPEDTLIVSIPNSTSFVMDKVATQSSTGSLSFGYHLSSAIIGGEEDQSTNQATGLIQHPSTVDIETGDWFIISNLTGFGTQSSPYVAGIAIVNNTYEIMTGAGSSANGAPGLVPQPLAANRLQFLRGDGA